MSSYKRFSSSRSWFNTFFIIFFVAINLIPLLVLSCLLLLAYLVCNRVTFAMTDIYGKCCLSDSTMSDLEAGLLAEHRVVVKQRRFRLQDLPMEIRLMIYEHIFDFGSIDKNLRRYLDLKRAHQPYESNPLKKKPNPPFITLGTPSILLACKSITAEALPMLFLTNLTLSYGIFEQQLGKLISPALLRKLRHITITDIGCREIGIPPEGTFRGYCSTFIHLAAILKRGHNLISIHLSFQSHYMCYHLEQCFLGGRVCGINSWVLNFRRSLMQLRNVKNVTLDINLPVDMKLNILDTMKTSATGLLALPYDIRKMIYSYAADFNDATALMRRHAMSNEVAKPPVKSVPTILQLNKQIFTEVVHALYYKTLYIKVVTPSDPSAALPKLEDYINLDLLSRTRSLRIDIDDFKGLAVLDQVVDRLLNNRHHVEKLVVVFLEFHVYWRLFLAGEFYPDRAVAEHFIALNSLRIPSVEIITYFPSLMIEALKYNMSEKSVIAANKPLLATNRFADSIDVEELEQTFLLDRFSDDASPIEQVKVERTTTWVHRGEVGNFSFGG